MAQGFGLGKEVVQGIGIALVCISIGVFIGSQIAAATSHGPEPHGEASDGAKESAKEAPAKEAPAKEAPAKEEGAK